MTQGGSPARVPPLRVVHTCTPASVGGLERVVQGLATGLAARGHHVDVIAVVEPDVRTVDFRAPLDAAGVRVHEVRLHGRNYYGEYRALRRLLRQLEPQVLHTHGYRADLLHGIVVRPPTTANVSTLHGSSRLGGLSHTFEWLQERALRHFDAVVAVSRPLQRHLAQLGVPDEALYYVPNATRAPTPLERDEARAALGADADAFVIGFIGRLIPIKGVDVLLQALAALRDKRWQGVIVGDGPERAILEVMAAALQIADRVRFVGEREHAARFLGAFDLFVLPSRSEGTPIVLLETMAAGVPVIASSVGGVPDVVRAPDEGQLVPAEDPRALADALRASLDAPDDARAGAGLAQARIRREYDFDAWIERHEALYASAMAGRALRRR